MITVRLSGGMGNQMFQYALGRKLSLQYNVPLRLDMTDLLDRRPRKNFTFREYCLDVFTVQAEVVSYKKMLLQAIFDKVKTIVVRPKGIERYFYFDPAVASLGPNACLQGYWQSPKYFSEIQDVIKNDFTLKDPLPETSRALLEEIRNSASVAAHVRRGDYVGNSLHDVGLEQEYYVRALAHVSERVSIEKIYVFSDDIAWCRKNLQFSAETVYVGNEHAGTKGEGHLMLMSACKHFVIPNSTFSWWAAWLSSSERKIVVAPKKWFNDGIITDDLIPEAWVRL